MLYSYETMIFIHKWLIVMMALLGMVDCLLIAALRKNQIEVNNKYVKIQGGYGLTFLTIGKAIGILMVSYFLLNPPANAGAVGAIALVYCLTVMILISDFIRKKVAVNTKRR